MHKITKGFLLLFTFILLRQQDFAQTATQIFNYTGSVQTFVVPPCIHTLTVQAWGGSGGGGGWDTYSGSTGGGGAYASSVVTVTPGTTYTVIVGGGGLEGGNCASSGPGGVGGFGLGNGAQGGFSGGSGCSGPGGGGGGGTGFTLGATNLVIAGGGGGGGGGGNYGNGGEGGGGGQNGNTSFAPAGVTGASSTMNGLVGASTSGDGAGGGGGGGGLKGGGGGGVPGTDYGGSGGAGGTSLGSTIMNGNLTTPGNSAVLTTYCSTCSIGGNGASSGSPAIPGSNGVLVIKYNNPPPVTGTIASGSGGCGITTATVTPSGGTPGYTYSWTPYGGTGAVSGNLTNGSYTVTITDVNGCIGTASTTLTIPTVLSLTASTTSITCNGMSTGSATATASGGTAPYSMGINTSPPQGGIFPAGIETVSGLPAGSYTFGVQDANGCPASFPITIAEPALLTVAVTQTNVTCNGAANGIANATPSGGTPPYSYTWTPTGGNSATATNLTPQNYTVTVTDNNLCTITASITITQPPVLTASVSSTNVNCNGAANGSATVTAGGGTTPYTYNWAPAGGNGTVASNLTPQNYTVTVTDNNLCQASAPLTITEPPVLTLTASVTNVTCYGLSNGSATATATGGLGPYSIGISSSPPQGGISITGIETASNLPAGSYTFAVQDANGCQAFFPITITQPAQPLSATTTQTNVSCYGTATGSASVTPAGGTPGYSYNWLPSGGTSALASNLTAQTYTVTVTDLNLCTTTATVTITQPPLFSASIATFTNVSCYGLQDGEAIVDITGGTAPYTYAGTNGPTNDTASNLGQGVYPITVTDANNCTATTTVTITQPPALTLTATQTNVSCNGLSTGSATATASGGTMPYIYAWSTNPPQVSLTGYANNLSAGSYTAGVQDAHGCQDTVSIIITEPNPLIATIVSYTNVSCFGGNNGSALAGVNGGTTPYAYAWNNGNTSIKDSLLTAGVYTLTVTDAHNCQDTVSVNITQPPLLKDSIVTSLTKNDSCFGDHNGSATAGIIGGTSPYTYLWSNGNTSVTDTAMAAGPYTFTVTDAQGCKAITNVTISQPPVLTVSSVPKTICIDASAVITANASGGNNPPGYMYLWSSNANSVTTNSASVSPKVTTTYSVAVMDVKGCTATTSVTVFVRDSLKFLAVSPGSEICPGFSAALNATGSGGDSTFTYTWNWPSGGTQVAQNFTVSPTATTIYTLTLSDNCGTPTITTTVAVIIDPLAQIAFTSDIQQACYPQCIQFTNNTQITSNDPITYSWNLGNNYTSSLSNPVQCYTKPGIYTVTLTATSSKGCVSKATVPNMITIYDHPKANFTYSPTDATILAPNIQFTSTSTSSAGSSVTGLFWQTFGDGSDSTSTLPAVAHTYQDTGTFCVKLIATNSFGCKDSITKCVEIKPYFTLYIPNSFTPNGDGRNEVFTASGDYVSSYDMRIFDRWGNLVFHSNNIANGWNGQKNGAAAQEDVYVYIINAADSYRNPYSYKGTVTLIK